MYRREVAGKERECVGTVVALYPGQRYWSITAGKEYTVPDHVGVKIVGELPHWWPYPDTDRFAPELADLLEC